MGNKTYNVVNIIFEDIKKYEVSFVPNSINTCSNGCDNNSTVLIKNLDGDNKGKKCTLRIVRHGTKDVANMFKNKCHESNMIGYDVGEYPPIKLNFFYLVNLTLNPNNEKGSDDKFTVYLAQGHKHNGDTNNWYIATDNNDLVRNKYDEKLASLSSDVAQGKYSIKVDKSYTITIGYLID